jgi:molybdopterin-binding protein
MGRGEPDRVRRAAAVLWRQASMRLSARNQLPGIVKTVTSGQVMAEVVVEVDGGHQVVAAITAESVRQLGLKPGKRVVAVVKSTEVMIGVDD